MRDSLQKISRPNTPARNAPVSLSALQHRSVVRKPSPVSSFSIHHSAFTLIELLVVMGIIVLLLGIAALAFNSLTGRRSTSMAQNQVTAMLAQMRAMALNDTSAVANVYGVFFFYDPTVDRAIMQPVVLGTLGDPDPNDQYKGWAAGVDYEVGDRVVAITSIDGRPMALRYRCLDGHTSAAATNRRPPLVIDMNNGPWGNTLWALYFPLATDVDVADVAAQQLPAGVGLQLLTDVTDGKLQVLVGGGPERYLQTGMILFDKTGKVAHEYYQILADSPLGRRLQLGGNLPMLYSQLGLTIYDREKFLAATQTGAATAFAPSDADRAFNVFGQTAPAVGDEKNEEQWLDENASLLLLDRNTGELKSVRK